MSANKVVGILAIKALQDPVMGVKPDPGFLSLSGLPRIMQYMVGTKLTHAV